MLAVLLTGPFIALSDWQIWADTVSDMTSTAGRVPTLPPPLL